MSNDAREKARQIAAKQARNNPTKSNRRLLQLGVLAVVLVAVIIVGFVFINGQKQDIPKAGPVPTSANEYGGIVITKDGIVKNASKQDQRDADKLGTSETSITPSASGSATPETLPLGIEKAEEAKKNGKPVHVVIFQDFNCHHCRDFEQANYETIKKLVEDGSITVEYRNMIILDRGSPTQYSARTANAAYAVANQVSTDKYLEFQKELFDRQGGGDLNNQQIADIAAKYGANISSDLNDNKWRPLVNVVNEESLKNGVHGTPAIYADGEQFPGPKSEDFPKWVQGKIDAKKQQ